jgi:hypothetical protein
MSGTDVATGYRNLEMQVLCDYVIRLWSDDRQRVSWPQLQKFWCDALLFGAEQNLRFKAIQFI